MANPFQQVQDGLWQLVEGHHEVDAIVRKGNRIKFDTRDPMKDAIAAADVPELILVPTDGVANLGQTSSSSMVEKQYQWMITTGEMATESVNALEWFIFTTHTNWSTVMGALTYDGQSFVKRVALSSSRTGFQDRDRNRGVKGWSSLWTVHVEMHFKTSSLRAELSAEEIA